MLRPAIFLSGPILALTALPALAQNRELSGSGELLDGVAALVETGVVLKSELRERMQIVSENFIQSQMELPPSERGQLPPVAILEQQVLEQLILEEIQLQRADQIGIRIGDNDLNQILASIAESAGMTLEQLPAFLEAEGVNYASFREEQRRQLTIQALERADVVNRISINQREFEQCINRAIASQADNFEYNTSHILIGVSANADSAEVETAEARIRDIARELDGGADFAQLAIAYSESQTALDGGSLGWRPGSALPTGFPEEISRLQPGEHSTPFRAIGGFHIVRLNDMRGTEPELVDQIRARHILLTTTEVLDDDAIYQKILGIRDQIVNGDDFSAVAAAVSDDTASAVDGGDLGWGTLDDYDPAFSAMLDSLEIGELSPPFQSSYGWHIAEVTDTRSYDMTDELREAECRRQIGNRKVVEERDIWRRRIRDQAYVQKRI